MVVLLGALALAGYGDAVDGYPRKEERDLQLWTNAARVAPEAFVAEYGRGGCGLGDFSASERTPQAPLLYNADLNEAARFHNDDMIDHGYFDHTSWDGTDFGTRVDRFYDGWSNIGENIALGYGDNFEAVMVGWMCSDGHRANIMGGFNEIGTASDRSYYTQDFGMRGGAADRALAMATHDPLEPGGSVTFYADYDGLSAPSVEVVLDGEALPATVAWGTELRGIYTVSVDVGSGCHRYWVRSVDGSGEQRFPEEGSYGWGDCTWDDPEAEWVGVQDEPGSGSSDGPPGPGPSGGDPTDDPDPVEPIDTASEDTGSAEVKLVACAAVGGPSAWGAGLAAVTLLVRARRRTGSAPGRRGRSPRPSPR